MATDKNNHQPINSFCDTNWFCDTNSFFDTNLFREMSNHQKKFRASILNNAEVLQAVSSRDYGNMALHTGDQVDNVIENRQHFLNSMGLSLDNLVAAEQIHGTVVQVVGRQHAGLGAWSQQTAISGTDALITQERGVILSIFTADCLPIFVYDPQTPAIAVIHAGWRGTIAQIAKLTINKMVSEFKTDPGNCRVAIGPSICKACFKVSPAVAEEFYDINPQVVTQVESAYQIDLSAFNIRLLQDAGVKSEQIVTANLCTGCRNDDFFSYRIEGGTRGRMMGIIALQ